MATEKAAKKTEHVELIAVDDREVRVTHPDKLYFSQQVQVTKLDLVRYYMAVAPGALLGIRDRPIVLKRFVNGAEGEPFYQKRAPNERPSWLETVTLSFPSGRTAEEVVVDDAAGLAWIVNLGCIELHPHPVRAADLDHPDELRIDLDPGPGVRLGRCAHGRAGSACACSRRSVCSGWPKTSGSRGIHVNVRIQPRWSFTEVRRAALALSRAVERRVPALASSKWWKEERHGVFLDYNQNAKDRTTASAYSVRPLPDARVSAPLRWQEVEDMRSSGFHRFHHARRGSPAIGDPHAGWTSCRIARRSAGTRRAGRSGRPGRCAVATALSQNGGGSPAHLALSRQSRSRQESRKRSRQKEAGAQSSCDPKCPYLLLPTRPAKMLHAKVWSAGRPGIRKLPRHLAVDDVLVDSHARTFLNLDADPRKRSPCSRGAAPSAGDA